MTLTASNCCVQQLYARPLPSPWRHLFNPCPVAMETAAFNSWSLYFIPGLARSHSAIPRRSFETVISSPSCFLLVSICSLQRFASLWRINSLVVLSVCGSVRRHPHMCHMLAAMSHRIRIYGGTGMLTGIGWLCVTTCDVHAREACRDSQGVSHCFTSLVIYLFSLKILI